MSYLFKGRLCGFLCEESREPLSNVVVRIYRNRKDQNVAALAVADPSQTLSLLSDDQVKAKASSLIAETTTNVDGNFSLSLGAEQKYAGEAFEIDVYCTTVPRRKPGRKPVQPRILGDDPAAAVETDARRPACGRMAILHPAALLVPFRGLFDAWVICGQLTTCADGVPIPGALVKAFDVDLVQDDPLGSSTTDLSGHFRIDYNSADFEVTPYSPLVNVEWYGWPGRILQRYARHHDTPAGRPVAGRKPGRETLARAFASNCAVTK